MIATAILNIIAFLAGMILLSLSFGWTVGLGVSCLVWFLKTTDTN